jgi:hypothetical protein
MRFTTQGVSRRATDFAHKNLQPQGHCVALAEFVETMKEKECKMKTKLYFLCLPALKFISFTSCEIESGSRRIEFTTLGRRFVKSDI